MSYASLDAYAKRDDAEWTLLFEIERRDAARTTIRLSDRPYSTTDRDDPYMCMYTPAIGGDGLPRLTRRRGSPFGGAGSTSYGTLTILGVSRRAAYSKIGGAYVVNPSGDRWAVNPEGDIWAWAVRVTGLAPMDLRRGARFAIKLAAPRRYFPYSSARVLMRGVLSTIGGDDADRARVGIVDLSGAFQQTQIPVGDLPQCYGAPPNVTPKLVDPAISEYAVHDGPIAGIDAVFDQGALISPSLYTVTPATGRFRLNGFAPVGTLTCNPRGAVVGGTWLSSTEQIANHLMDRASQTDIQRVFNDLPDSTIGLYLTESKPLGETLTNLLSGCGGDWIIDKLGVFRGYLHASPLDLGESVNQRDLLGGLSWDEEPEVYSSVRYLWSPNWTQLQPRAAVSAEMATFVQSEGKTGTAALSAPDVEIQYLDAPLLRTYFVDEAPARAAAQRLLKVYGQIRRRLRIALPYAQERELGDTIMIGDGRRAWRGVIDAVTDVRGRTYPKQELEVLA